MKLSILLPTRGGARFLPDCLDAVLPQCGPDVELVVSDNANDDGTREVLAEYANPFMVVVRQANVLSVTDNWTAALDAATGDYMWMVGDDDLVLPGAAVCLKQKLQAYGHPDCLSFGAFTYIAPGSISGGAPGYWARDHFKYGQEYVSGAALTCQFRKELIGDLFRFRVRLPLNMQLTVFSRDAVARVKPNFFRPPFPDHYALSSLLLKAESWYFSDYKALIVGVSPKSFGHYFYSGDAAFGLNYLGTTYPLPHDALPGNELLSLMYAWLVLLKSVYPDELSALEVSRGDYVARQLWAWFVEARLGRISLAQVGQRVGLLRLVDLWELARMSVSLGSWRLAQERLRHRLNTKRDGDVSLQLPGLTPIEGDQTIARFAEAICLGSLPDGPKEAP